MRKLLVVLPPVALALLGACATSDPVSPAPAPVVVAPAPVVVQPQVAQAPVVVPTPTAIRAGHGRIESINATGTSSAAGGTTRPVRRVGIKMDDGTVQYVDTAAENLSIGQRVELTSDGQIKH